MLLQGTLNEAEIARSPELRVESEPSRRDMVTPAVPDPAGTLFRLKLTTGGVAEAVPALELAKRLKLEALTVLVEGNDTVRTLDEMDGVEGFKVVAVLLG